MKALDLPQILNLLKLANYRTEKFLSNFSYVASKYTPGVQQFQKWPLRLSGAIGSGH